MEGYQQVEGKEGREKVEEFQQMKSRERRKREDGGIAADGR